MAFNYSTSMFIGVTTQGVEMPVFFDTHTPIFNNKPPGILITGQPGSGKTFLALTLTSICAILGKVTIVLDPKGDFLSLKDLGSEIGDVNFWNLANRKKKGILDPFYMAFDKGEQLDLVISVIDMFVGGLKQDQLTVLAPIVKDVQESPVPSLLAVTESLLTSERNEARNLGAQLDLVSRLPFADLCFAPGSKKRNAVDFGTGITIITMVGLELTPSPESGAPAAGGNATKQRLSSAIFFLLTDFVRRTMYNDTSNKPKTLIIDEAWAVLSTTAGAECVKSVARLGRSKKLAMILVTQNNSDLKRMNIENTITTRFAFRTDPTEAADIVTSMQLPEGEGFEGTLTSLGNGECLLRDFQGRYSTMQVSNWKENWNKAFKTNPLDKMRAEKEKKALEDEKRKLALNGTLA